MGKNTIQIYLLFIIGIITLSTVFNIETSKNQNAIKQDDFPLPKYNEPTPGIARKKAYKVVVNGDQDDPWKDIVECDDDLADRCKYRCEDNNLPYCYCLQWISGNIARCQCKYEKPCNQPFSI